MTHDPRTPRPRRLRLVPIVAVATIGTLVSACSSSGSGSPASSAAAPAGNPGGGATSTSAPAPTSSSAPVSSSAPSSASGGGGIAVGGSFCDTAKAAEAQSQKQAGAYSSGDPATLEKVENEALSELKAFVAIAPSAIKSDVELLAGADQKLFDALQAAKFMITKINPSVLSAIDTPAFKAAEQHITVYLATNCGIKVGASGSN